MYVATQFSVFMVNKPGVLANALGEFAKAKINVTAMTMVDSAEHGVMRVVFTNSRKAREVLKKINMPFNETEVLCVNIANKAGAFADVAEKLARNHINIAYAYCTAGAKGGRTTGVLKVANVKKAMGILHKKNKKATKSQAKIRSSHSQKM